MPTETSIHKPICDAMVLAIQGLDLDGIDDDSIETLWGIDTDAEAFPAIFVCPAGTEAVIASYSESDDIAYPVAVFIVDRVPLENADTMDQALLWRKKIRQRFSEQRVSVSGAVIVVCHVDPSPVLDVSLAKAFQLLVEPLVFRVISRESRG